MPEYRIDLQTASGVYIDDVPFRNLQGEFFFNKPCQMRWDAPLTALSGLSYADLYPGITEAKVFRNGVNIYTGPIWNVTASSQENNMNFSSQDLSSYFSRRVISADTKFTNKTFGYMAWSLINANQSMAGGGLGITLGTQVSTGAPKGSQRYAKKSGTVLWKAIDTLASAANGFDWYVGPDRAFRALWPRPFNGANISLEHGGNLKNYTLQIMGAYEANYVMIRGPKKLVSSVYIDATRRTKYGLRQFVEYKGSLKSKKKLDAYARKVLNLKNEARFVVSATVDPLGCNPLEGDISIGQVAKTYINDGWSQYSDNMRMTGYQLTVGKQGQETFVLYLSDMREVIGDDTIDDGQ